MQSRSIVLGAQLALNIKTKQTRETICIFEIWRSAPLSLDSVKKWAYQDVSKCSKHRSHPRLDVDLSLRRIWYMPTMSDGNRSGQGDSGDYKRSVSQLWTPHPGQSGGLTTALVVIPSRAKSLYAFSNAFSELGRNAASPSPTSTGIKRIRDRGIKSRSNPE
jgi:hypothetical protein